MIRIVVNGEPREFGDEATVAVLVEALDLLPEQVAVEVNRELVPRAQRSSTQLQDGDRVELVTLVGGG